MIQWGAAKWPDGLPYDEKGSKAMVKMRGHVVLGMLFLAVCSAALSSEQPVEGAASNGPPAGARA